MTIPLRRWLPPDILNTENHSDGLIKPPWVRHEDGQPLTKHRRTTKVELQRRAEMTPLRPALQGNPIPKGSAKMFYDSRVYKDYRHLMEQDWALYISKFCVMTTCIDALMTLRYRMIPASCQHHMHLVSEVTEVTIVPHACRPRSNKNRIECKHGAPWVQKSNHVDPLLICKKIAKTRKLKCTGARNVLGTILGVRNDEWLNESAHAFCVAVTGSNYDFSSCAHNPITTQTLENSVCKL